MITDLGVLTIGDIVPAGVTAIGAANASIGIQLGELQAKLAGLLAAQVGLIANPPSLLTQVAALQEMIIAVQVAIALGVPDVQFQLAAVVELIAAIQATIASLTAQLSLIAGFGVAFGAGGLAAFLYQGTATQMHSDIRSATQNGIAGGGPLDSVTGLLLATSVPATVTAMTTIFGVP